VTVQQSAAFSLNAEQREVPVGGAVGAVFSASNLVKDTPMEVKLSLELPAGVSVTGVSGGSLVSRAETDFVTVAGGGQESLTVNLQFNDAGDYTIGGEAIYYIGGTNEDRRVAATEQINVSVTEKTTPTQTDRTQTSNGGTPVFPAGGIGTVLLIMIMSLYFGNRNRT
jgi:hypothetical protein